MPYTAGIALMYGAIKEEHFDDPYLHDPALLELVGRIKCVVSEEANGREPEAMLCDLDVTLKDGRKESVRVEYHRGHSKNFMSDAEIEEKFHSLADPVLPRERAGTLAAQLWKLDGLKDVGVLFDLMRVG
jgi:2-methylcitrate dehydratase